MVCFGFLVHHVHFLCLSALYGLYALEPNPPKEIQLR